MRLRTLHSDSSQPDTVVGLYECPPDTVVGLYECPECGYERRLPLRTDDAAA